MRVWETPRRPRRCRPSDHHAGFLAQNCLTFWHRRGSSTLTTRSYQPRTMPPSRATAGVGSCRTRCATSSCAVLTSFRCPRLSWSGFTPRMNCLIAFVFSAGCSNSAVYRKVLSAILNLWRFSVDSLAKFLLWARARLMHGRDVFRHKL